MSAQNFLTRLVCNLLDEGNASLTDGESEEAVKHFSEALNISHYADEEEDIQIPKAQLESLYVDRASAFHRMVSSVLCSLPAACGSWWLL